MSNKNSVNDTSTLQDDAVERIAKSIEQTKRRKSTRRIAQTTHKEVDPATVDYWVNYFGSSAGDDSWYGKQMVKTIPKKQYHGDGTVTDIVKVATIQDIPEEFERIGTGFYRNGHHLWELTSTDGGLMLVRKHGEDHVLGYDPDPIIKTPETVMDRNGNNIKTGSRITVPHRGRVTAGTVIIIQPGTMGVQLDSGEKIDTPPDMCELLQEKIVGNPVDIDDERGGEFEPDVEPSSKQAQKAPKKFVAPKSKDWKEMTDEERLDKLERSMEDAELRVEIEREMGKSIKPRGKQAQTEGVEPSPATTPAPRKPTPPTPPTQQPGEKWRTQRQLSMPTETMESMKKESKLFTDLLGAQGRIYIIASNNPEAWYEIELAEIKEPGQPLFTILPLRLTAQGKENVVGWEQFKKFEAGTGGYRRVATKGETKVACRQYVTKLMKVTASIGPDHVEEWNEYWYSLGQYLAQRKPMTPEQKERRKQRRKERQMERKGLPPGTPVPPKTQKSAADAVDEIAGLKEKIRLYQQCLDEIEYVLQDESLREDEVRLVDEMDRVLQEYHEQFEEAGDEKTEELDRERSIEEPMEEMSPMGPGGPLPKLSRKIVVSMNEV